MVCSICLSSREKGDDGVDGAGYHCEELNIKARPHDYPIRVGGSKQDADGRHPGHRGEDVFRRFEGVPLPDSGLLG
jgi:hypothetical protein